MSAFCPSARTIVVGLATGALLLWASAASADPEAIARLFVKRVQAGDVAGAKKLFGDPKMRSQPREGDDAYFVYESGESRNLAFLVGRPFDVGQLSMRESRSDWFFIDGTLYAYVTVPSLPPDAAAISSVPPSSAFNEGLAPALTRICMTSR